MLVCLDGNECGEPFTEPQSLVLLSHPMVIASRSTRSAGATCFFSMQFGTGGRRISDSCIQQEKIIPGLEPSLMTGTS